MGLFINRSTPMKNKMLIYSETVNLSYSGRPSWIESEVNDMNNIGQ